MSAYQPASLTKAEMSVATDIQTTAPTSTAPTAIATNFTGGDDGRRGRLPPGRRRGRPEVRHRPGHFQRADRSRIRVQPERPQPRRRARDRADRPALAPRREPVGPERGARLRGEARRVAPQEVR